MNGDKKVKISDMSIGMLNFATAWADGVDVDSWHYYNSEHLDQPEWDGPDYTDRGFFYRLLVDYGISIVKESHGDEPWIATMSEVIDESQDNFKVNIYKQSGTDPNIAAMRCLIAAKLGVEVEIPDFIR